MRHGYPLFSLIYNNFLKMLAGKRRQEKEIKEIQTIKWAVKQSLFTDDMSSIH